MISITKQEKDLLVKLFPHYKFPRTMKQDSKRHHYFCTESEELMRPIANSNAAAAKRVNLIARMHFGKRGEKVKAVSANGLSGA